MQWFTVAWWRWRLAQARGRNPLVRTSDRIEVAVMALAVAVSLAVVPVAGAIGTAVHDEHARGTPQNNRSRHRVAAHGDRGQRAEPEGAWSPSFGPIAGQATSRTPGPSRGTPR